MPFCPQCGHKNEPGDKFCGSCGATQDGAGAPPEAFKPEKISMKYRAHQAEATLWRADGTNQLDPPNHDLDGAMTKDAIDKIVPDYDEKGRDAFVDGVYERVAKTDTECHDMVKDMVPKPDELTSTVLLENEKVVAALPVVGFKGGPSGFDGRHGDGHLVLTEMSDKTRRLHFLMQSADSNTNFKEWLTSGTQTVGFGPSQQVMVLDDVLTIYRHDHTKKGIYSVMSVDGEMLHAHSEWFAKAQLSTFFEGPKLAPAPAPPPPPPPADDCCKDCCKCCPEPPAQPVPKPDVGFTDRLDGYVERRRKNDAKLSQKNTLEKAEDVPAPASLGMERAITGLEIKQTHVGMLNTLNLVIRNPDAPFSTDDEKAVSICAVIHPSASITDVMKLTSMLQMSIPKQELWATKRVEFNPVTPALHELIMGIVTPDPTPATKGTRMVLGSRNKGGKMSMAAPMGEAEAAMAEASTALTPGAGAVSV